MRRITERWIPEDATGFINEDAKTAVYCYGDAGTPLAVGYSAKRKKPDFHLRFKSVERRNEYIKEFEEAKLRAIQDKLDFKAKQKEKNEREFSEIKVGDIFVSSWGYERTNVDAYQLVELKGKTGIFREIGLESVKETSWGSDRVKPIKDNFTNNNTFKKRLNGDGFNLSTFQHASKIKSEEDTFHRSWYD